MVTAYASRLFVQFTEVVLHNPVVGAERNLLLELSDDGELSISSGLAILPVLGIARCLYKRKDIRRFRILVPDDHNLVAECVQLTSRKLSRRERSRTASFLYWIEAGRDRPDIAIHPERVGRRRQVKEMFPTVNLLYVTMNRALTWPPKPYGAEPQGTCPISQQSFRLGQLQPGTAY